MTPLPLASADGAVAGRLYAAGGEPGPLLVCIHGGGCNGDHFDLKGCSTLAAARDRGLAVLLVDRPGHGASPPLRSARPVADGVEPVRRLVDEVRAAHRGGGEVALIGHSIGGAVALMLAAGAEGWPLRAVAVSGIGDRVAPGLAGVEVDRRAVRMDAPAGLDALLFENGGAPLSWRPLAALRRATEPWLVAEVVEVMEDWPRTWPRAAPRITAPVHFRLAEHERLWETGPEAVRRMAGLLAGTSTVDAAVLPEGGHIYEASRRGPELVGAQLDFILARPPAG